MRFDDTHITIRERSLTEILDLSARVIRIYWRGLLTALLVGALPFALLNHLLIGHFLSTSAVWNDSVTYLFWLVLLMTIQSPLATAPMTLFLGQATFHRRVRPLKVVRDFVGSLTQMVIFQVVLRILTGLLLVIGLVIPYTSWPYLSEVILLERNPLKAPRAGRLSTWRRSRSLHRHASADIVSRWMASLAVGLVLLASLQWGMFSAVGNLTGTWPQEVHLLRYYLPLAAWIVVGFFAVVRFLSYLDLRIRCEGWEVELMMRAEAARLVGAIA